MLFERIVPKIDQKYQDLAQAHIQHDMPLYDKKLTTFDYNEFDDGCPWLRRFENNPAFSDVTISFLNYVEVLAQAVLSGLVDEDFAYRSNGLYFINVVNAVRVYIAANREGKNSFAYSDTITLFERWNHRNESERVSQQHMKSPTWQATKKKIIKPIGFN
ncbi:MAG: hypothetical protein WA987_05905 [Cellvibrio sp.]